MVQVEVTEKIADIIYDLSRKERYFEIMAFISNVQEAAMEARSCLTKEQIWDLFTAIQEYKCLIDELANYLEQAVPLGLHLYREEEKGEL